MKKILLSFILLLSATIGMAQSPFEEPSLEDMIDEEGYFLVSSFEDLEDVFLLTTIDRVKSNAKIRLKADIYLDRLEKSLVGSFQGVLDGDYITEDPVTGEEIHASHIIYGSSKGEDPVKRPHLFGQLDDAEIRNVTFCNIRREEDFEGCGMIAITAHNSKFENIIANNISLFCDESNVGTLVGRARDCEFKGIMIASCDVTADGVRAGGVVGISENCKYHYCINNIASSVFADGTNWTNDGISGGIVGDSQDDEFYYCTNFAMVAADQCEIGGITGVSKNSNFHSCTNNGIVYQCDSEEFESACEKQRARCKNITLKQVQDDLKHVVEDGAAPSDFHVRRFFALAYVIASASQSDEAYQTALKFVSNMGWKQVKDTHPSDFVNNSRYSDLGALVASVLVTGIVEGINVLWEGDDEVGGMTGQATGGTFEYCTNTGTLGCKDDNLGGIIGLGYGVTINNCMNIGKVVMNEEDTSGSIIGKVDKNGDTPCKITNCLSTTTIPMIGTYHSDWSGRVDNASGNNYYLEGGKIASTEWDNTVPKDIIMDGTVAYWLNNGIENRNKGLKPWHMTKGLNENYPVLDTRQDGVTLDDLTIIEISSPQDLLNFATEVNKDNGNQFAKAILMNDINMNGFTWTPIGKDETNKHFRGIFDGKGHTISGLTYTSKNNEPAGLFGAVHAGAEIRNVIIGKGSKFIGPKHNNATDAGAGGIVGQVKMSSAWKWGNVFIENCGSYADIEAGRHGGGILGKVDVDAERVKVYVNKCFSMGTVTASDGNSGLLCGYMKKNGVVRDCWSGGQLRTAKPELYPYSIEESLENEGELLVGYTDKLDIANCYVFDPDHRVDKWESKRFQNGVTIDKDYINLANGQFAYILNGETNNEAKSLTWEQNLGTDSNPVFGNKGVYHSRKVSNKYGTVCLPYLLRPSYKISYFYISENKTEDDLLTLKFRFIDEVPPGLPVLFRIEENSDDSEGGLPSELTIRYEYELSGITKTPQNYQHWYSWNLHGTFEEVVFTEDEESSLIPSNEIFYLSNGVIKNAKKTTIAPFRAFFWNPDLKRLFPSYFEESKTIRIVIEEKDGSTTDLNVVGDDLIPVQNGKSYSIMGTEVGEGYRGIVITNGKKILRK